MTFRKPWGARSLAARPKLLTLAAVAALGAQGSGEAQYRAPEGMIQDCAMCPVMVVIPSGHFVIGSSDAETRREGMDQDGDTVAGPTTPGEARVSVTRPEVAAREKPATEITVARSFAIGRTEVTVAQYRVFAEASGYESAAQCRVYNDAGTLFETVPRATWQSPGFAQTEQDPVVCISWYDATAYAAWLTAETGYLYRLPSEAEWEYAARSGSTTARYWGDGIDDACKYANVGDQDMADHLQWTNREFTCRDGYVWTAPVAQFEPNAWGLYDVLGNAWEWIEDCWNGNHTGRPTDQRAWLGENCATLRMNKGASWSHFPWGTRSAVRNRAGIESSYNTTGVRLVRELE